VLDELEAAGERLDAAVADLDGEAADRLRERATELHERAASERGPDHGRLARIEATLREIRDANPAVEGRIDDAIEHLHAYRETVPGV
jgi:hypothetical protein